MAEGLAHCQMIFEDGRATDFVYLAVNPAFETLTGLKNVIGKRVTEILPGIRASDPELIETYGRVARTGKPERCEVFLKALSMWLSISVYSPEPEHFVAVFDVITERKQLESTHAFLLQSGRNDSGEDFFRSLARYLAHSLRMDFVCIDQLEPGNLAARTVAVFSDGKFEDNVTYTLRDTPCGDVVGKKVCVFPWWGAAAISQRSGAATNDCGELCRNDGLGL